MDSRQATGRRERPGICLLIENPRTGKSIDAKTAKAERQADPGGEATVIDVTPQPVEEVGGEQLTPRLPR